MSLSAFLSQFSSFVWGAPLMVLLVGTGLYLTLRLYFIQLRGFPHGVGVLRGKYDKEADPGEITHFSALSTALSGTIGTGNIVGVAAAILIGGPGAVFWMWITACVGMATKFASCTLSVHYRKIDEHGEAHGGPMYFIEMGMGRSFKWLAVLFAAFTTVGAFGAGNMFQINNIVSTMNGMVHGDGVAIEMSVRIITGILTAGLVASVILGGIKRIANVASRLVPFMCILYIIAGLIILIKNAGLIYPGLQLIWHQAFHAPEAVTGGLLGGVIRSGVARGLFSNEAGLGTAPMAHAAARTKEPVREGLVAMLGPFIDTIVVCSITALVIICTGAYETVTIKGQLTSVAFEAGLPGTGWLVSVSILLFAFSSIIAWSYYGDRAAEYLVGQKSVRWYRYVYVLFVFLGALRPLDDVINFCDALNGLMAIPNLIALISLSPVLAKITKDYMARMKSGTLT